MSDTRLICFEGLPGSGKSTTSQRLWLHLLRHGREARWVYEHDATHPIWKFEELRELRESGDSGAFDPSVLDDVYLDRWRQVADGLAGAGPTTIMESALFQTPIGILLPLNVAKPTIVEHLLKVEQTIAGLQPALIYIRNADVARALRATCNNRQSDQFESALIERLARTPYGRAHRVSDFVGLTDFFERFVDIANELFDRFEICKLSVDQAAGWPGCERAIAEFLRLPTIEDPPTDIDRPARYLGRYRDAQSDDEIEVAADAKGLYLAGGQGSRLIYNIANRFYVQSIGIEVEFEGESGAKFEGIRLVGNLPGLSPLWLRTGAEA